MFGSFVGLVGSFVVGWFVVVYVCACVCVSMCVVQERSKKTKNRWTIKYIYGQQYQRKNENHPHKQTKRERHTQ